MSFSPEQVQALARELHESERSRVQVEHFSKRFPGMTIEDGYAVSRAWVALKIAEGRKPIGHKIGLTSRAMQQSSQIDEPDYGTLLDDMVFDAGNIPTARFLEGRHVTAEDVLDATDYVTPAIEIIDARIEQFDRHTKAPRRVQDTISDNAANAGIIMAGKRVKPREVDLPWCGAILRANGAVEETGLAAGVQGHPAIGVAWLAMKLAPWGECLEPGEVVLAGSFTRPVPAKKGDVFDADYGPLGRFGFRFV
jgi:2-oxo-hept-3-ene-1,7-dioate hydratase